MAEQTYTTLRSIEERKAQLLKEIRNESNQMGKMGRQLFEKPKKSSRKSGFMPSTFLNKGVYVLDGLLLAWKLYRKFKK